MPEYRAESSRFVFSSTECLVAGSICTPGSQMGSRARRTQVYGGERS